MAPNRPEASVYRVLARFLFLPAMSLNSDLKQLHFGRVDQKTFSLCIVASGPIKLCCYVSVVLLCICGVMVLSCSSFALHHAQGAAA